MAKAHIKKDNNYKNVKECITMKNAKNENIDAVMKNQQLAQDAMPVIVKELFEFLGLNTESLNEEANQGFIKEFANDFNATPQKVCDRVFSNDNCKATFNVVMTDREEFACTYNKLTQEVQFIMYMQIVMYLTCSNYTSRAYMLNTLLESAVKYKNTEEDHISERAWTLFLFLIEPRLVLMAA